MLELATFQLRFAWLLRELFGAKVFRPLSLHWAEQIVDILLPDAVPVLIHMIHLSDHLHFGIDAFIFY